MGSRPFDERAAGAHEIAGAVRREARHVRAGQVRTARLLYDSYGWGTNRIARELDLEQATVTLFLAADGIRRCVDCAFGLHRSCLGVIDVEGPCECEHQAMRAADLSTN